MSEIDSIGMKYRNRAQRLGLPEGFRFGIEIEVDNVNTSRNITNFRRNLSERFKGVFTGNIREHRSLYYSRESNKFFKETLSSHGKPYKKANFFEESLVSHGGAEVISPILYDNEHDWDTLIKVCEHVQKYPGKKGDRVVANHKCGAHVHFDAGILDYEDSENLDHKDIEVSGRMMSNFLRLWAESEELVYKMCNDIDDPMREGAINNKVSGITRLVYNKTFAKINGMASPTGKKILQKIEEGNLKVSYKKMGILKQAREKIIGKSMKRYVGLNLTNLGNPNKNTIEFRMSNGSLNPEVLKQNVFLYASVLNTSREMTLNPEKYQEKLSEFYKTDMSEKDKAKAFTDLIFNNDEDKKIYIDRWESVKDEKIFADNASKDFAQGRFNREGMAVIAKRTPIQRVQDALANIKKALMEKLNVEKSAQIQTEGGR